MMREAIAYSGECLRRVKTVVKAIIIHVFHQPAEPGNTQHDRRRSEHVAQKKRAN